MAGVIYLDIDDEITSAAARIRSAEGSRVAVVLPYGSRVATSRINFRLLARDALTNGKRLSIVAGDGATRALAASAGLPIFATVGEYESSLEDDRSGTEAEAGALAAAAASGVATGDAGPDAAAPVGDEDDAEGTLVSETVATPKPKAPVSGKGRSDPPGQGPVRCGRRRSRRGVGGVGRSRRCGDRRGDLRRCRDGRCRGRGTGMAIPAIDAGPPRRPAEDRARPRRPGENRSGPVGRPP